MTDEEITREAQSLMVKMDAIASAAIESLKTDLDVFHDTKNGEAVYNQEFPIVAAKAEFLRNWIKYEKERLTEVEEAANGILKLWNDRYNK